MITVTPNKDCKACRGEGFVSGDWVDYGSTKTQLPDDYCDCVIEQLPEDYDGEIEVAAQQNIHLTGLESAEQERIENEMFEWGNPSRNTAPHVM